MKFFMVSMEIHGRRGHHLPVPFIWEPRRSFLPPPIAPLSTDVRGAETATSIATGTVRDDIITCDRARRIGMGRKDPVPRSRCPSHYKAMQEFGSEENVIKLQ
jgi:hypothetical protein